MVVEVNKLIANLLLAEHAVSIPGVGSLRAVRQPAERLSRRRIRPAYYAVEFSSECCGTSLADAIAAAARCDAATGQDACARWLSRTRVDGVLTIRGVGVLRDKGFTVDSVFEQLLNPQGREPLVIRKPATSWMLWAVASFAIVCGVGVCGWIVYDRWASGGFERMVASSADAVRSAPDAAGGTIADVAPASKERAVTTEKIGGVTGDPDSSQDGRTATSATAVPGQSDVTAGMAGSNDPASLQNATAGSQGSGATASEDAVRATERSLAGESGTLRKAAPLQGNTTISGQGKPAGTGLIADRLVSGRTYVVLGVYSTEQNGRRAAQQAASTDPTLQPALYFYGPKFMLSVFSSDDPAACAAFVRAHATRFPDAWCYTAR